MAPLSSVSSAAGPFALQSLSDLDRRRQELYRRLGIRGAAAGRGDAAAAKGQPEEEAHDWEIVGEEAAAEKERAQLRRMAFSECGVPCSWRPAESQTVTIFDWDDTLLCTSFLVRRQDDAGLPAGGLLPAASLPAAAARCLRAIAAAGQGLLRLALQCGRTFIITNAVQGWVERSAALYAPELLPVLREVHIISARRSFEAQFPNEVGAWKVQAFLEVQRQLDVQRVTNLISIGDSNYEIEAVHAMGRQFKRATVKTVKLLENPRPEVLLKQLKLVAQKFKRIVAGGPPAAAAGGLREPQREADLPRQLPAMSHSVLQYDGHVDNLMMSKAAMQSNSFKCRNTAELSRYVDHNALEKLQPKKGDHDYAWRSHATNFARGGIYYAGKSYTRDPRSGVWFNSRKVEQPGCARATPAPCHYMESSFDRPGIGSAGPGTGMSFRATLGGPFKRGSSEPSLRPLSPAGMHHRHVCRPDVLRGATVTIRSP